MSIACWHTNQPVASDFSRECITATGLHGKSEEVIVVLTPCHSGRAKSLWLMSIDAKAFARKYEAKSIDGLGQTEIKTGMKPVLRRHSG